MKNNRYDVFTGVTESNFEYDEFNEVIQSINDNSLGNMRYVVSWEVPEGLDEKALKIFLRKRRHACIINVGDIQKAWKVTGRGGKYPWKRFTVVVREFLKLLAIETVSGRINFRWNGMGDFMLVKKRPRIKGSPPKYSVFWDKTKRDCMIDASYTFRMPQSSLKETGSKALIELRKANKDPLKKTVFAPFSSDTTNYQKRKDKIQGINKRLVRRGEEPIRKYFGSAEQKKKIKDRLELLKKLAEMHEAKRPEYAARLREQKDRIAKDNKLYKEINEMLYTLPEVMRRELLTYKKDDE